MHNPNHSNFGLLRRAFASAVLVAAFAALFCANSAPAQTSTEVKPGARTGQATEISTSTAQHHGLFAVTVAGQGPAIILIPGLSSSGDVWNGTVDHLKAHYQCHVLTLAGFAGAPAWAEIDKGKFFRAVEDELATYIAQNKLAKPVIVGHSLGGTLTLEFAERYPEVPGPLVIVDSLPFLAGVWLQAGSAEQAAPVAMNMKLQIKNQTHDQYLQFVKSGASTRSMVTGDADFGRITEWGVASDQNTVAEAMYELLTTDARPSLSKIPSDVLVFATWAGLPGLTSKQVESTDASQYAGLKRLHLVMAGQERHFIMLDNPAWFYAKLDGFLASRNAAASNASAGDVLSAVR